MSIFRKIQKAVEILTNRRCENCKYKYGFFCRSPKGKKCNSSIYPIGYEPIEKGGAEE